MEVKLVHVVGCCGQKYVEKIGLMMVVLGFCHWLGNRSKESFLLGALEKQSQKGSVSETRDDDRQLLGRGCKVSSSPLSDSMLSARSSMLRKLSSCIYSLS